jgi:hypothetical protein
MLEHRFFNKLLKDAWRNYVSHGRKSYGPLDALMALQHSMAFIEKLAPHL